MAMRWASVLPARLFGVLPVYIEGYKPKWNDQQLLRVEYSQVNLGRPLNGYYAIAACFLYVDFVWLAARVMRLILIFRECFMACAIS